MMQSPHLSFRNLTDVSTLQSKAKGPGDVSGLRTERGLIRETQIS